MLTLIYFILVLGLIVLVHEFGHFIFAKMFGVRVYEFSIGMGPRLCGTKPKKGKTTYNLRLLPIGGYVSLAGEDPTEEFDPKDKVPDNERLYNKPVWQRFLIMFFGAGNNFILAFLLLFFIGLFYGSPDMTNKITKLDETYPMYEAGIREGDYVISMNGHSISTVDDMTVYFSLENGKKIDFVIERDGKEYTYSVDPIEEKDENDETVYKYGVVFEQNLKENLKHGFLNSLKYAFVKIGALIKQMVIVLSSLFTGKLGLNRLSGPVGIYNIVGEATVSHILLNLANLTALLCVNVGFINLLPLPALDGGRLVFLIIEKIKGSPVSPKTESIIHSVGFYLLMLLMLIITISDIIKLF